MRLLRRFSLLAMTDASSVFLQILDFSQGFRIFRRKVYGKFFLDCFDVFWQVEMIMELKGSQTEKNLLKAFAGESQARNRYSYFAKKAKKDGFEQIAAVFEGTAEHERAHAKRFFKFLKGGEVEITATFPAGVIGSTAENLRAAASGEHFEWEKLYPSFARPRKDRK